MPKPNGGSTGGARKSWSTSDLDFDPDGNLEIKDTELGNALLRALTSADFKIWMYDPLSPTNKINLQCPC